MEGDIEGHLVKLSPQSGELVQPHRFTSMKPMSSTDVTDDIGYLSDLRCIDVMMKNCLLVLNLNCGQSSPLWLKPLHIP